MSPEASTPMIQETPTPDKPPIRVIRLEFSGLESSKLNEPTYRSASQNYTVQAWYRLGSSKSPELKIGDVIEFETDADTQKLQAVEKLTLKLIFNEGSIFSLENPDTREYEVGPNNSYEVKNEGVFDFECVLCDEYGVERFRGQGGSTPNPGPKRVA